MDRHLIIEEFIKIFNSYKNDDNLQILISTNLQSNNIVESEYYKYCVNNYNQDYRILLLFDIYRLMLCKHSIKIYKIEGRLNLQNTYNYFNNSRKYILDGLDYGYINGHFDTKFD